MPQGTSLEPFLLRVVFCSAYSYYFGLIFLSISLSVKKKKFRMVRVQFIMLAKKMAKQLIFYWKPFDYKMVAITKMKRVVPSMAHRNLSIFYFTARSCRRRS